MLYDILKILHIISATLLLTSAVYCCRLWYSSTKNENVLIHDIIPLQTWNFLIPLAIFQLATGFTMISLKQYALSELWIMGTIGGFIILIICWFTFLYTLLITENDGQPYRKLQQYLIIASGITTSVMIFFMANKTI